MDFSFPNLWTFRSRTCGLFIPELVDFSFPNLWTFRSGTCGLFVPELVDFSFLLNNRLYERQFVFFESMVINHLHGLYIILGFFSSVGNMNMHRLVVIRVEHKTQSNKDEDCRHNSSLLLLIKKRQFDNFYRVIVCFF